MSRLIALAIAAAVLLPASAPALQNRYSGSGQKSIPWSSKVEESIAQAKKSGRPLMFYIEGDYERRDDRDDESRRKAFMDADVLYAVRNFVAVQAPRSHSAYRRVFEKLQVPENVTLVIVFATPELEKIDEFYALHQADSLAQKAAAVFSSYRKRLFDNELKPKLEDKKTSAAEIKRILKTVEEFTIVEADQALVALPEQHRLDNATAAQLYATLAELSTPKAVEFLIAKSGETGQGSAAAADALEKCTPAAAEEIAKLLDDEEKRLMAYKALVKICKIASPKPDRFWEGKNERLKSDEIERVKKEVEKDAKAWRKRYGEYR